MENSELVSSSGEGGGVTKGGTLFFALVTAGKDPLLRGEASVIVSGEGLGDCGAGSAAKLLVSSSNSRRFKISVLSKKPARIRLNSKY